jgi:hypothetical protein
MNDISGVSGAAVTGGEKAGAARPLALDDLVGERQERLPRDYPRQPGDAITLSTQAREIQAGPGAAQPAQSMGFWDHSTRSAPAGNGTIGIDPSGSYKLD